MTRLFFCISCDEDSSYTGAEGTIVTAAPISVTFAMVFPSTVISAVYPFKLLSEQNAV